MPLVLVSRKPLLIDSGLLVLLVVGLTSELLIQKHKRTKTFSVSDFHALLETIGPASNLVLLPNIVTEASNHLDHHGEPERSHLFATLKRLVSLYPERYVRSLDAAAHDVYHRLGVADAAILVASAADCSIITTDAKLHVAALSLGLTSLNFWHLQDEQA